MAFVASTAAPGTMAGNQTISLSLYAAQFVQYNLGFGLFINAITAR